LGFGGMSEYLITAKYAHPKDDVYLNKNHRKNLKTEITCVG
jgi:hypothetical protein